MNLIEHEQALLLAALSDLRITHLEHGERCAEIVLGDVEPEQVVF